MPVNIIDTLKPKNGGSFPIVEAIDVFVEGYSNLADAVSHFVTDAAIAAINAVLSGKANTSDVNTAVSGLQAQIDQIVISASAETVVAPEVAQARVDENGIEYSTLKERVDSDYNMLSLAADFENLFDSAQALDNQRLVANGTTETEEGYYTSAAIPVESEITYTKYGANDTGHRVCFYDVNNIFISATSENVFETPQGTSYARFSGLMREKNVAYFHSVSAKDQSSRNAIVKVNEKYSYETAVLSTDVSKIESAIFDKQEKAIKISNIFGVIAKTGFSAAPSGTYIGISAISAYDTYYLITKKPVNIWTENVGVDYYSITYGKGYIRTAIDGTLLKMYCSGDVGRFRKSENNLPTKNTKFTAPANTVIAITVTAGTDPYIFGFDDDLIISDEFKEEVTSDAINTAVNSAVDTSIATLTTTTSGVTYTENSSYTDVYDSQYADAYGLHESDTYISWGVEITSATELYVISKNGYYFSVCVYNDKTMSQLGVRYRAMNGGEDTLPYENSPISLTAGQYIIFTVQKNHREFAVRLSDVPVIASYNGDIPLAVSHINQVKAEISDVVLIRYSTETGTNITERVHVYVPTGIGFVEYEFVHNESDSVNADIWRVNYAYACSSQFERRFALTTAGEWEIAVHLADRDDFSGGIAHGDQVLTDVVFFVDGAVVDITEYTDLTPVTNFVVAEASNLYDPADHTTVIGNHGSEHIFTKDGLKIRQSLLWTSAQELANGSYMAMHLPAKAITDHMYIDNSLIPFEIENYNVHFPHAKYAVVYGEDSGVRTEFSIGEYPQNVGNGDYLLLTDNGGNPYNKCYYVITVTGSVAANTLWKTETYYKFDVNK